MIAVASCCAIANAQPAPAFPVKPIRVIVPSSPGGGLDFVARAVGQQLSQAWGHSVVIDNRAGAGGTLGPELVARAAPDGYTLMIVSASFAVNPSVYPKLPYDTLKDFYPILQATTQSQVLAVHPQVAARNVKEFVALAKAKPGALNYSSPGDGTLSQLAFEIFKMAAGVNIVHIPYKGAGFAVTANIANEVQTSFLSTATAQPHVKAGRLKPLVVVRKTRFAGMPDVPSAVEAGYPELDSNAWFGLFAPAKTPKHLIMRVNKEVADALNTPHVRETLLGQGAEVAPTTPEAFGEYVRAEVVKWTRVVKESGYRQ